MIRILHIADLHLDAPFEGMRSGEAARRRAEQRSMLGRVMSLAAEYDCDIVLIAGDLMDSANVTAETAAALYEIFEAAGIPIFISPGNHDFYRRGSKWDGLRLPENVHVFKNEEIECVALPALNARIWGAGFTDRYCSGLLAGFSVTRREGMADVLCLHGVVGEPNSPYGNVTEGEIASSGMDYIAMGHSHSFSGLRRAGDTFYAWPGCPEGRSFDETGEKGCIIADVECGGGVTAKFVPVDGRRYYTQYVNVSGGDAAARVIAALPADASRDLYRICLTGECAFAPDMESVRLAVEGRVYGLDLRDETTLRHDIWDRAGEDSLRGAFLRRLKKKYELAVSDEERERITGAARWGLAALDNGEEVAIL